MNINIKLGTTHVDEVSQCSGIYYGENRHLKRKAGKKANQGFGSVSGKGNAMRKGLNIVADSDCIDKISR